MRKYSKLFILAFVELIVLVAVVIPSLVNRHEPVILSPGINAWESRYVVYEGAWYTGDNLFESQGITEESIDLIYGPYMALPRGCYNVSIAYESDTDQTFEVYSGSDPGAVFIHEPETLTPDSTTRTYHFTLLRAVDDLEVRVHYDGNGSISVSNINVTESSFLTREIAIALLLFFILLDVCLYTGIANVSMPDRETWIDVCRGIGIILVLLGHTDPPFKWLIFGFHMPFFFILSGYLYKDGVDTKGYISKLFKNYMIPYFILCGVNLVIVLVQNALDGGISLEWVRRYISSIIYTGEYLPNCTPLWFLPALFVTMIMLHFIHKADSRWVRLFIIAGCATAAIAMDRLDCPALPWGISQAIMGVVFAKIGSVLKQCSLVDRFSGCKAVDKIGVLIVLLVCGIDSILYNHESTGEIASMYSLRYNHFPLWITGAVCASLAIMFAVSQISSGDKCRWSIPLEVLGRHTILFFAFDFCMGSFAAMVMNRLLGYDPWYFIMPVKLILLIAVFAISYYVINPLFKKRIWFL